MIHSNILIYISSIISHLNSYSGSEGKICDESCISFDHIHDMQIKTCNENQVSASFLKNMRQVTVQPLDKTCLKKKKDDLQKGDIHMTDHQIKKMKSSYCPDEQVKIMEACAYDGHCKGENKYRYAIDFTDIHSLCNEDSNKQDENCLRPSIFEFYIQIEQNVSENMQSQVSMNLHSLDLGREESKQFLSLQKYSSSELDFSNNISWKQVPQDKDRFKTELKEIQKNYIESNSVKMIGCDGISTGKISIDKSARKRSQNKLTEDINESCSESQKTKKLNIAELLIKVKNISAKMRENIRRYQAIQIYIDKWIIQKSLELKIIRKNEEMITQKNDSSSHSEGYSFLADILSSQSVDSNNICHDNFDQSENLLEALSDV